MIIFDILLIALILTEIVDSNRRIAVSFDSKELSRAFKNFNKIHVCLNTLKPQLMRAIYPAHIAGL